MCLSFFFFQSLVSTNIPSPPSPCFPPCLSFTLLSVVSCVRSASLKLWICRTIPSWSTCLPASRLRSMCVLWWSTRQEVTWWCTSTLMSSQNHELCTSQNSQTSFLSKHSSVRHYCITAPDSLLLVEGIGKNSYCNFILSHPNCLRCILKLVYFSLNYIKFSLSKIVNLCLSRFFSW